MLADGTTTAQISASLFCSEPTAKRRLRAIFERMRVPNRTQAVEEAMPGQDGYYLRLTVLTDVESRDTIAQTEVFGPVAAILPVLDAAEALALANDTPFGLSASLFTANLAEALRFARECRVGVVKVNQETAGIEYQAPFGGMKESSSGSREQGKIAREFMTEWKTISFSPS